MPCSGKIKTKLHIAVDKWVAKHKKDVGKKYNPYAVGYTVLRRKRSKNLNKNIASVVKKGW